MSRSGYSDDCDGWDLIRWRGAVKSALRGQRGQAFLHELLAALDALPKKRLIANDLIKEGEVCALGAIAVARNLDVSRFDLGDSEQREEIAAAFGIAPAMAAEIMFENDERWYQKDNEAELRFAHVYTWIKTHLKEPTP